VLHQQDVLEGLIEYPDLGRDRIQRPLHRRLQPGARIVGLIE
jgi:hypothetical protein